MKREGATCIDTQFYLKQIPHAGFEESRAIVLAKYEENELEQSLMDHVKTHLGNCICCRTFSEELGKMEAWKSGEQYPYAVCPSSRELDAYVFNRGTLPEEEVKRIEKHMLECPMCREETEWIENLERGNVMEYSKLRIERFQYAAIAAAMVCLALAGLLWFRDRINSPPADQLRALAVIKHHRQLDYAALTQTSRPMPPDVEARYQDGVDSLRAGNFKAASQKLGKVLDAVPDHSASLFLMGYCYYQMNEPEKAFELCDKAEKVHPHSMERCLSLVHIALKTGHFGRAIQEISVLYHEAPQNPEVRDLYHRIHDLTAGKTIKL